MHCRLIQVASIFVQTDSKGKRFVWWCFFTLDRNRKIVALKYTCYTCFTENLNTYKQTQNDLKFVNSYPKQCFNIYKNHLQHTFKNNFKLKIWKCHILEELYKNIEHKKSWTKNTVALNINFQQVNIFHIHVNKYEHVNLHIEFS